MGKGMDLINLYLDGYTAICVSTIEQMWEGGLQRFDDQLLSMSTWRVSFRQNIPTTKLTPVTTTGYHRP